MNLCKLTQPFLRLGKQQGNPISFKFLLNWIDVEGDGVST